MARAYNAQTFGSYGADWIHRGYAGCGNVAGLLDSLKGKTAIVVGNAKGVFEEFSDFRFIFRDGDPIKWPIVFAVNDVGMYLPHIDHWVSLHSSKLAYWVAVRRDPFSRYIGNMDFKVHSHEQHAKSYVVDYHWQGLTPLMALSGMFAAQIAYLMGCDPIILCGCPNDATPRFWETQCTNNAYVETQKQIIQEMGFKPEFKKVVRSMSGWTREFFGGV